MSGGVSAKGGGGWGGQNGGSLVSLPRSGEATQHCCSFAQKMGNDDDYDRWLAHHRV